MRRNWIGALLLAGSLLAAVGATADDNLSPATKRLFDAVWSDDMARVKASLVDGADLTATNEFGVRAVDLAVDKGHYDIAHYLLSVEKLRDDPSTTAQPVPTPVPTPVPAPVPAPAPVATVSPAPMTSGSTPSAVAAPQTIPGGIAAPNVSEPPPQTETLWKPTADGQTEAAPQLKILGTANPQPVAVPPPATSAGAPAPAPSDPPATAAPKAAGNIGSEPSKPGFFERVTDFLKLGSGSETKKQNLKLQSSNQSGEDNTATGTEIAVARAPEKTVPPPHEQPVATPQGETAAAPPFLDRISDFFRSGDAPRKNADSERPEIDKTDISARSPAQGGSREAASASEPSVSEKPAPRAEVSSVEAARPEPTEATQPDLLETVADFFKSKPEPKPLDVPSTPTARDAVAPKTEQRAPEIAAIEPAAGGEPQQKETSPQTAGGPSLLSRVAEFFKGRDASAWPDAPEIGSPPAEQASIPETVRPVAEVSKPVQPKMPSRVDKGAAGNVVPSQAPLPSQSAVGDKAREAQNADSPNLLEGIARLFETERNAETVGKQDFDATNPSTSTSSYAPKPVARNSAPSSPPPTAALEARSSQTAPEAVPPNVEPAPTREPEPGSGIFGSLKKWLQRDAPEKAQQTNEEKPSLKIVEKLPEKKPPTAEPPIAEPAMPRKVRVPVIAVQPSAPMSDARQKSETAVADANVAVQPAPAKTESPSPKPEAPVEEIASISASSANGAIVRRVKAPRVGPPVENPAVVKEPMIVSSALKDIGFMLGEAMGLGRELAGNAEQSSTCVEKHRWQTKFCIEPVSWPKKIAPNFRAESTIYRGEKAIVQYVSGKSVQVHALFPTTALWAVSEYFKERYGPPTEIPEVWTALIGAPKRPNRVLRWHSWNSKTGKVTILEIREIDDLRWSAPPDTKHGVARILEKGRGSVFQLLSITDLMLVSLRNRSQ